MSSSIFWFATEDLYNWKILPPIGHPPFLKSDTKIRWLPPLCLPNINLSVMLLSRIECYLEFAMKPVAKYSKYLTRKLGKMESYSNLKFLSRWFVSQSDGLDRISFPGSNLVGHKKEERSKGRGDQVAMRKNMKASFYSNVWLGDSKVRFSRHLMSFYSYSRVLVSRFHFRIELQVALTFNNLL